MKKQITVVLLLALFFIGRSVINAHDFHTVKKQLPNLLKNGAIIVDVRTSEEFKIGSNPKSINLPLDQIETKLHTLDKQKTIIVCCRSGKRSKNAMEILKKHGFRHVVNAGPWTNTVL